MSRIPLLLSPRRPHSATAAPAASAQPAEAAATQMQSDGGPTASTATKIANPSTTVVDSSAATMATPAEVSRSNSAMNGSPITWTSARSAMEALSAVEAPSTISPKRKSLLPRSIQHHRQSLNGSAQPSTADEQNRPLSTANHVKPTRNNRAASAPAPAPAPAPTATTSSHNRPHSQIRSRAAAAVESHKIFTMYGSCQDVRRALHARGWLEKPPPKQSPKGTSTSDNCTGLHLLDPAAAQRLARVVKSMPSDVFPLSPEQMHAVGRLLAKVPPGLVWTCKRDDIDFGTLLSRQYANHFPNSEWLTTKWGLAQTLYEDLAWSGGGSADDIFPRCYHSSVDHEMEAFVDHFRLNAAAAIVANHQQWRPPAELFSLVLKALTAALAAVQHADLDESPPTLSPVEWQYILQFCYRHRNVVPSTGPTQGLALLDSFQASPPSPADIAAAELLLSSPAFPLPQRHLSADHNIWIVKPAAQSRGRNIVCDNCLEDILAYVAPVSTSKDSWVIQKYIERPLLINRTKFDIRQWVLVSSFDPLTVWVYRDSYLRFSSVEFNLGNLHGADSNRVHLCNNSIQKHATQRDTEAWAPGCMWTCWQFQDYLKEHGHGDLWLSKIYPEICQLICKVMQAAQPRIEPRPNSFEVFGVDLMLDEHFNVWLIEVNCSPDMSYSTAVTEKLVKAVGEDIVKVVFDSDKPNDVGRFELVLKLPLMADNQHRADRALRVDGKAVLR